MELLESGSPILSLAHEDTDRFIDLVGHLSPMIQDIFLQYYLLGRTYEQIGALLFPHSGRWWQQEQVKKGNEIGLNALCAVIAYDGPPPVNARKRHLVAAYQEMLRFDRFTKRIRVRREAGERTQAYTFKIPKSLGLFAVTPNGDLGELFPPSWSVLKRNG
jgi:hypothetical protein